MAFAAETTPNDAARFLAGLSPASTSPLTERAQEARWKRHASFFDNAWGKLEKRQLAKIRNWRATALTKSQPVLYYMFSGPDFLYANAFFPNARVYVLSGLEPVGAVPEMSQMSATEIASELGNLEASLNTVLAFSFFKTKNMETQLRAGKVNGTLPILYLFLARSGKTIEEVSFVELDQSGVVFASGSGGKGMTPGVKIDFSDPGSPKQTLYYFTTDLSNSGIKKSGFMAFCYRLKSGDSFVKSASYLMHSGAFSDVREFLLANSVTLLQDDSGIPIKYFNARSWDLQPYGRYLGPISLFKGNYQTQLARLFKQDNRKSIDFGVGYRWRPNESNLLLAVRADSHDRKASANQAQSR